VAVVAGRPVELTGQVVDGPNPRVPAEGADLTIDVQRVDGAAADGRVKLTVSRDVPPVLPGDRVRFKSVLVPPFAFANPGVIDVRLAPRMRGVLARARVRQAGEIHLLTRGARLNPGRLALSARVRLRAAIEDAMPPPEAALLRTAVLGERAAVGERVEAGFKAAGATHALSVSGLHLAAVAGLVFFLLRRGLLAVPTLALRLNVSAWAAAASLPAVLFYTLMTGSAVATLRSALMAGALFVAIIVNRAPSIAGALAAAALAILVDSPLWLADISFQLSFASVIALALFARPLAPGFVNPDEHRRWRRTRRALRFVACLLVATTVAGLVTAPLAAFHFGEVTPGTLVGNLVLTPLVEWVLVPVGLAGATLGALWQPLGTIPLHVAAAAAKATLVVAEWFRAHVPVWRVNPPSAFAAMSLTLAALAGLSAWAFPSRRRLWAWLALLAGLSATTSVAVHHARRLTTRTVKVTFLDVGQGDAAVIEGPRGFVALVDAGGLAGSGFDTGARIVGPFLRRRGIRTIDLVILSHPHPDHMDGLFHIVETFRVGTLWALRDPAGEGPAPEAAPEAAFLAKLLALARARGTTVEMPHSRVFEGLRIQPVGPFDGDAIGWPPGLSVNDASLAVRVSYGDRAILFAGDLEGPGELELCGRAARGVEARSAVLKAPHHGSRTSSSDEFLDSVAPDLVVISAGRNNRFGFPHPEVLARLERRGIAVLRTDLHGAVTLNWRPSTAPVSPGASVAEHATCVLGCR
jgi:competence protein ComEC